MKISVCSSFFAVISAFCSFSLHAETLLWTKEIVTSEHPFVPRSVFAKVGTDGSSVIAFTTGESFSKISEVYWLNRSGDTISTNQSQATVWDRLNGVVHVSSQELILSFTGVSADNTHLGTFIELFQESFDGTFQQKIIRNNFGVGMIENVFLNYPYIMVYSGESQNTGEILTTTHTFKLYDLTNPNAISIVGDAVIGIRGSNLQVRWKTVANAKYRVQYSHDLETWTDYTETIDGNGSTMVVNLPIDGNSEQKYARVIKL